MQQKMTAACQTIAPAVANMLFITVVAAAARTADSACNREFFDKFVNKHKFLASEMPRHSLALAGPSFKPSGAKLFLI